MTVDSIRPVDRPMPPRTRPALSRRSVIAGALLSVGFSSGVIGLSRLTPGVLALPSSARTATQPDGATPAPVPVGPTPDLEIVDATVRYAPDLDLLVFELRVAGEAGATTPEATGAFDGAPVLGYVIPTTLPPGAIGFLAEGIVALAITSHPDFDDTPLWDENDDGDFANDGGLWHVHWTLLVEDERAPGGLAVREVVDVSEADVLLPTNAEVPLYLDSPGFPVALEADSIRVVVPAPHVEDETVFNFDAVSASLFVNTSDPSRPTLGVYDVYGILSGDLSLPYTVEHEHEHGDE